MRTHRLAISAAFVTGLAALPLSAAQAQYYAPCSPFPLTWPFCAAGAVVGAAATIATAPFWLLSGTPPFGYYAPPYYAAPSYYAAGYYAPPYSTYAPPYSTYAPSYSTYAPPAPAGNAYYFCPTSKSFYPNVASCAVAWRPVPTTPPK
ncbi:MAG TPA: hypothetical protein VET85_13825 [Stellaceae bacterium]|nr:hypothetical protein [Stellaceae bacterium]